MTINDQDYRTRVEAAKLKPGVWVTLRQNMTDSNIVTRFRAMKFADRGLVPDVFDMRSVKIGGRFDIDIRMKQSTRSSSREELVDVAVNEITDELINVIRGHHFQEIIRDTATSLVSREQEQE